MLIRVRSWTDELAQTQSSLRVVKPLQSGGFDGGKTQKIRGKTAKGHDKAVVLIVACMKAMRQPKASRDDTL